MILQAAKGSQELAAFDAIMDPMILIYLSIAVVLFTMFSYSKPELRLFIVPMVALWLAMFFMTFEIEIGEALFVAVSGGSMVFSVLNYQNKMKSNQK